MPVQNIYPSYVVGFSAFEEDVGWTTDVNIPAQTVYASAALSCVSVGWVSGGEGVFCGILLYFKLVDGVPFPRFPSPTDSLGVAPAIFDSDVTTVVFAYGASGSAYADCNFQILGYG